MDFVLSHIDGQWYYNLFYQVAVIGAFVSYFWIGLKRKFPLHDWLLINLSGFVFMTIGMHVATFSFADWQQFFSSVSFSDITGKTSIGALLGFFIGVGLAQKVLKTRYPILDAYAFIIPGALAIQRLGCLMAGCCYGIPTESPIGVNYADHFMAFGYHSYQGLIPEGAQISLAVHPVPVYFIIASIITILILIKVRKHFRQQGSLFLVSIILLSGMRFFIEFFRDPVTNHQIGGMWAGLKIVQWTILAITILAIIFLINKEFSKSNHQTIHRSTSLVPHITLTTILALLLVRFAGILTDLEIVNLLFQFVLLTIIVAVTFIQKQHLLARLSPFLLIIFAALWMGQTDTLQETPKSEVTFLWSSENKQALYNRSTKSNSHIIGGAFGSKSVIENIYSGGGGGSYFDGAGCSNPAPRTLIKREEHKTNYSAGYYYEHRFPWKQGATYNLGVGFSLSDYTLNTYFPGNDLPFVKNETHAGFVGIFGIDKEEVGMKVGAWGGKMHWIKNNKSGSTLVQKNIMPVLQFRFGSLDRLSFSAGLADDFQYGLHRYVSKVSLDLNFGHTDRLNYILRIGYTNRSQILLDGEVSLSREWSICPSAYISRDPIWGLSLRYTPIDKHRY